MSRRQKQLLLGAVALTFIILLPTLAIRSEPVHDGLPLTQWLIHYKSAMDRGRLDEAKEAAAAIQNMDKDAIRCLLSWTRVPREFPSRGQKFIGAVLSHMPSALRPTSLENWAVGFWDLMHARYAPEGFRALGPKAASAIPQLEKMATGDHLPTARSAIQTLAVIGPPALPALQRIARSGCLAAPYAAPFDRAHPPQ